MPTVLITPEAYRDSDGPHVALLREAGFDIRYPVDPRFARGLAAEEKAVEELGVAEAVIAGGEWYTETILAALPRLRVIARSGVGYDRVDVAAATARRIAVTITPNANHEAVAEQALALLFAVAKSIVTGDRSTRSGEWPRAPLRPVRGQVLGIFGLGRIGRSMAVRAVALRMEVIAHDPFADEAFARAHDIELVDFDTLLARSDYLTIHCPLNDETRGLFDASVFAKMRPGSVLINTARGEIVDERDLIAALRNGPLTGAGLDVFEQEPPVRDNPLFEMDHVALSPHIAGMDTRSGADMALEAADSIIKLSRGDWPAGAVVNDELRDGWAW